MCHQQACLLKGQWWNSWNTDTGNKKQDNSELALGCILQVIKVLPFLADCRECSAQWLGQFVNCILVIRVNIILVQLLIYQHHAWLGIISNNVGCSQEKTYEHMCVMHMPRAGKLWSGFRLLLPTVTTNYSVLQCRTTPKFASVAHKPLQLCCSWLSEHMQRPSHHRG